MLDGIQRADVPRETRRFLLSRAVDRSVQAVLGQLPAGRPEMNVASELEEALGEVSIASGNPRADVTSAKTWLRGRGAEGKALAAELGRLSTARNVWAHPRRNLLDRIRHVASDEAASLLRPEASALMGAPGEELGAGFAQSREVDEKIHKRPNAALLEVKAGGIPVDKLEVQFGDAEVQPGKGVFDQADTAARAADLEAGALVISKLAARLSKLEEVLADHSEFKERTTNEVEVLGRLAALRVHELDQIHAKLGEHDKKLEESAVEVAAMGSEGEEDELQEDAACGEEAPPGDASGTDSGDDGDEGELIMAAYAKNYQRLFRQFRAEGQDDEQAARSAAWHCDEIAEGAAQELRDG